MPDTSDLHGKEWKAIGKRVALKSLVALFTPDGSLPLLRWPCLPLLCSSTATVYGRGWTVKTASFLTDSMVFSLPIRRVQLRARREQRPQIFGVSALADSGGRVDKLRVRRKELVDVDIAPR